MYIDIHSHVIWGVDDGAQMEEETFRMLREAAADGIGAIICTPHLSPGVHEFPEERFQRHFREAEAFIRQEGLELRLFQGAEVLYNENMPRFLREGRIATLAGGHHVLVEFSPADDWAYIQEAVQKVAGTGYTPVVAHIERYPAIWKKSQVRELKSRFHARIQVNCSTVCGGRSFLRGRFLDSLFREGLVDFIATDTHALPGRQTCMTEGMKALESKFGQEEARRIAHMPELLLRNTGKTTPD